MPSSRDLGYELGMAAVDGRVNMAQRLLAAGADMEVQVPVMQIMMTPLNAAAYANNVRRVSLHGIRT